MSDDPVVNRDAFVRAYLLYRHQIDITLPIDPWKQGQVDASIENANAIFDKALTL